MGQYIFHHLNSHDEYMREVFDKKLRLLDTYEYVYELYNGVKWNVKFEAYLFKDINYITKYESICFIVYVDGVIRAYNYVQNRGTDSYLKSYCRSLYQPYTINSNWHDLSRPGAITDILASIHPGGSINSMDGKYKITFTGTKQAGSNTFTMTTTVTNLSTNTVVETVVCNEEIKWMGLDVLKRSKFYNDDLFDFPSVPECFYGPKGYQTIGLKYGASMSGMFSTFPHTHYTNKEVYRWCEVGRYPIANVEEFPYYKYTIPTEDSDIYTIDGYDNLVIVLGFWWDSCMIPPDGDDSVENVYYNNPYRYRDIYPRDDDTINIVVGSLVSNGAMYIVNNLNWKYNTTILMQPIEPKLFTITRSQINAGKTLYDFYTEIMTYIDDCRTKLSYFRYVIENHVIYKPKTTQQYTSTSENSPREFYIEQVKSYNEEQGNVVNYV